MGENSEKHVRKLINRVNYERNKEYHREYYQKNGDKYRARSRKKWAEMSNEEKQEYYQNRKAQRIKSRRVINRGLKL